MLVDVYEECLMPAGAALDAESMPLALLQVNAVASSGILGTGPQDGSGHTAGLQGTGVLLARAHAQQELSACQQQHTAGLHAGCLGDLPGILQRSQKGCTGRRWPASAPCCPAEQCHLPQAHGFSFPGTLRV